MAASGMCPVALDPEAPVLDLEAVEDLAALDPRTEAPRADIYLEAVLASREALRLAVVSDLADLDLVALTATQALEPAEAASTLDLAAGVDLAALAPVTSAVAT